mgnify:FL=1
MRVAIIDDDNERLEASLVVVESWVKKQDSSNSISTFVGGESFLKDFYAGSEEGSFGMVMVTTEHSSIASIAMARHHGMKCPVIGLAPVGVKVDAAMQAPLAAVLRFPVTVEALSSAFETSPTGVADCGFNDGDGSAKALMAICNELQCPVAPIPIVTAGTSALSGATRRKRALKFRQLATQIDPRAQFKPNLNLNLNLNRDLKPKSIHIPALPLANTAGEPEPSSTAVIGDAQDYKEVCIDSVDKQIDQLRGDSLEKFLDIDTATALHRPQHQPSHYATVSLPGSVNGDAHSEIEYDLSVPTGTGTDSESEWTPGALGLGLGVVPNPRLTACSTTASDILFNSASGARLNTITGCTTTSSNISPLPWENIFANSKAIVSFRSVLTAENASNGQVYVPSPFNPAHGCCTIEHADDHFLSTFGLTGTSASQFTDHSSCGSHGRFGRIGDRLHPYSSQGNSNSTGNGTTHNMALEHLMGHGSTSSQYDMYGKLIQALSPVDAYMPRGIINPRTGKCFTGVKRTSSAAAAAAAVADTLAADGGTGTASGSGALTEPPGLTRGAVEYMNLYRVDGTPLACHLTLTVFSRSREVTRVHHDVAVNKGAPVAYKETWAVLTVRSESVVGNSKFCGIGLVNLLNIRHAERMDAVFLRNNKNVLAEKSLNNGLAPTKRAKTSDKSNNKGKSSGKSKLQTKSKSTKVSKAMVPNPNPSRGNPNPTTSRGNPNPTTSRGNGIGIGIGLAGMSAAADTHRFDFGDAGYSSENEAAAFGYSSSSSDRDSGTGNSSVTNFELLPDTRYTPLDESILFNASFDGGYYYAE